MKKILVGSIVILTLGGCNNLGDTTLTRSGDNTGLKSWEVSQVFKWGKQQ